MDERGRVQQPRDGVLSSWFLVVGNWSSFPLENCAAGEHSSDLTVQRGGTYRGTYPLTCVSYGLRATAGGFFFCSSWAHTAHGLSLLLQQKEVLKQSHGFAVSSLWHLEKNAKGICVGC